MARFVEGPWYRASKNTWYATIGGRKVSLQVRGKGNRAEAHAVWIQALAAASDNPVSPAPKPTPKAEPVKPADPTVRTVTAAFLADVKGRVKKNTHGVYGYLLGKLVEQFGDRPAGTLTPGDLLPWVHALDVSRSTRADVVRVTATAYRWAEAKGQLPANPLRGMKRPTGESRGAKAVVSEETHGKLVAAAHPSFRSLLVLLWETGARPGELAALTAADVDLAAGVAILNRHKTADQTGKPRVIALPLRAGGLPLELPHLPQGGELLRTRRGQPWTKDRIVRTMTRTRKAAGVTGATAYGYRHGYATDALAKGVPDATVAALLGHTTTQMLHKHYSHLTSQTQTLRAAAGKVRG